MHTALEGGLPFEHAADPIMMSHQAALMIRSCPILCFGHEPLACTVVALQACTSMLVAWTGHEFAQLVGQGRFPWSRPVTARCHSKFRVCKPFECAGAIFVLVSGTFVRASKMIVVMHW